MQIIASIIAWVWLGRDQRIRCDYFLMIYNNYGYYSLSVSRYTIDVATLYWSRLLKCIACYFRSEIEWRAKLAYNFVQWYGINYCHFAQRRRLNYNLAQISTQKLICDCIRIEMLLSWNYFGCIKLIPPTWFFNYKIREDLFLV